MNHFVVIEKKFSNCLINIITPFIYEGFVHLYNQAKKLGDGKNELKLFQSLIKAITTWNQEIINNATNRILKASEHGEILEKLLKSTLIANIMLLSNGCASYKLGKINKKLFKNTRLTFFIHNCYKECGIVLYDCPYLFFHGYKSIDLKKNEREVKKIIRESIKDTINKILPLNFILDEYLNNSYKDPLEYSESDFDITEKNSFKEPSKSSVLKTDLDIHTTNSKLDSLKHKGSDSKVDQELKEQIETEEISKKKNEVEETTENTKKEISDRRSLVETKKEKLDMKEVEDKLNDIVDEMKDKKTLLLMTPKNERTSPNKKNETSKEKTKKMKTSILEQLLGKNDNSSAVTSSIDFKNDKSESTKKKEKRVDLKFDSRVESKKDQDTDMYSESIMVDQNDESQFVNVYDNNKKNTITDSSALKTTTSGVFYANYYKI